MIRALGLTALSASVLLVACGGSDSSSATGSFPGQTVDTQPEDPGDNCQFGGVALAQGIDADGDGSLADDEIDSTIYLCNGDPGTASSGTAGGELVGTTTLKPGDENCPSGGVKLVSGSDENSNGKLDVDEVTSTQYLCNGADMVALVTTEDLAVGDDNCPAGGVAFYKGIDANRDGSLAGDEIDTTSYACNAEADGSACIFPAMWDPVESTCTRTADWTGMDLSGASLASEYLAGVVLANADLTGADLSWSELRGADLSGADLTNADLSNASVNGADFSNVVFDGADLSGVDFDNATLDGASGVGLVACPRDLPGGWRCLDLGAAGNTLLSPGTILDGIDLTGADLSDANLRGIQFTNLVGCPAELPPGWHCLDLPNTGNTLVGPGANLSGLDLTGADFSDALNLRDVNFSDSTLTNAVFANGTNLDDANFTDAVMIDVQFGNNVDLGEATFTGADLSGATFGDNVDFSDANLRNVDLSGATIGADANFDGANLANADLSGATIGNSADFQDANLSNADLSGLTVGNNADFQNADLGNADLTNATLNGATLDNADLGSATLNGLAAMNLDGCPDSLPNDWDCIQNTLVGPGANLAGVDLEGADLSGMDLTGVDFTGANLINVDLSNADLTNADLTDADLTDADMTDATITNTTLTGVTWDNTTCPSGTNSDDNNNTCP